MLIFTNVGKVLELGEMPANGDFVVLPGGQRMRVAGREHAEASSEKDCPLPGDSEYRGAKHRPRVTLILEKIS